MPTPQPITANQAASGAITAGSNLALTAASGGSGAQLALQIPALGASAVGVASAMGASWATAAIPFIGPIVAGVTLGLAALFSRKSGKQKVAATQIVDEAEPLLADNVNGYLANPTPEAQIQALGNFDYVWSQIISPELCGNPALGSAGRRCISERQAGGKWDWFRLYRDPITQQPPTATSRNAQNTFLGVVSNAISGGAIGDTPTPLTANNPLTPVFALGAIGVVLWMAFQD